MQIPGLLSRNFNPGWLDMMNNAIMNIGVQVFTWLYVLNSLGYILKGGVAGAEGQLHA